MLCWFKLITAHSDLIFLQIRLRILLKNSEISLKKFQKKSKSVCGEAGELKFGMNILYFEYFKE
jgi:hypothetical protein